MNIPDHISEILETTFWVIFVPAERAAVELHGAGDENEAGAQLLQYNHTLALQLYTMKKPGPKPSVGVRDILVRIRIADPYLRIRLLSSVN
jgi:hypothetical protein